jgi:hypothetical protein
LSGNWIAKLGNLVRFPSPDSVIFAAAAKRAFKRRKGHSSEDVKRFAAFWAEAKYGKIGVEGRDPVNA